MIKKIALFSTMLLLLTACAPKYHQPTSDKGMKCVRVLKELRNACYRASQSEVNECERVGREYDASMDKERALLEQEHLSGKTSKDQFLSESLALSLQGGFQRENCSRLTQHCDDEYNREFVNRCGGVIK